MLHDIQEIRVQGWQLEVYFNPLRIAGLGEGETGEGNLAKEMLSEDFAIKADYPFAPETERGRYLDRRQIMGLLKENPKETAKSLAASMGRSACMVRNRMEELTRGGYIRFNGRGGRGEWEILKRQACGKGGYSYCLHHGRRIPNSVTLYSHLFKLDLVMMSIVILCILSAMLYQGIAWLEKKVL